MSYISDYKCGAMDYDEYKMCANEENRRERYFLEHQFDEDEEKDEE